MRSAFAAWTVIRSAGATTTARGRSENALRDSSSWSRRMSSIRMFWFSGETRRRFGWDPEARRRQSWHAPHPMRFRQKRAETKARAVFSLPIPSSPKNRRPGGMFPVSR